MKSKLSVLFIFIFLFLFNGAYAQLSKKHFIPPLTYAETGNANPEQHFFYISTPSASNVSFTIKQIGFPDADIKGSVSRTTPQEFPIGNGDSQLFVDSRTTSIVHNNKGYIIEANDVIYVSIRVLAGGGAQAGALVSKGTSALGKTFRAGMFTNENPQSNYLNFISVMASEDNTQISFDDLPTGLEIKNYTGTFPISTTLNEGESYILATNSAEVALNRDGLIGTLINADKPIIVNTGSANGSFHNGGGRDYGIDQIVGVDKIGSEYIFVKGNGSDGWENVLIVAHQNATEIFINDNSTATTTINAGEYYLIEGNNYNTNGNMYVSTSKPVFAYQGIGANNSEANQGLFFVPPLSCENRGKVDNIPIIESIGTTIFSGGITIVTNKGAVVTINDQPIANFATSGPFDVDGNSNYVTYKVTNLTGNISIESSEELYCAYFNQNGAASSGSFFSGFPSNPEINFDTTVNTLGNCIPNVTLEAANTDAFDAGIEWFFDDESGSGFLPTGITDSSYTPTKPGKYQLVGRFTCSFNDDYRSISIPVSLCPDDFDGDLIIDNVDIDLDNDGIPNCEESLGNAIVDISDTDNPSLIFSDSSTNNSIISSIYIETENSNSIKGDNLGNFESIINPEVDSNLNYQLNFTQKISFKITQNTFSDHIQTDEEFFILKIGPVTKNVTLLDPDDQLLIDSNFDGIFEDGVINISASEIHFKYKSNTPGSVSTFQFLANQVDQISFEHRSSGITTPSTFRGNIQLTCFALDSDNDGIEDALDLDSDNDGIPDIYEASSPKIVLSNTDANLDGLDDVFDGVTTNIDSDGDGIPNTLDLDSDNDGIFDSTEAGHNLDLNFDGLIDDITSLNVGTNGLFDNLETSPNDKLLVLNFVLVDTDNDGILNFLELDSDNDYCFDVIEAGFSGNGSGNLFSSPSGFDANGVVINNADGYTQPNNNYITSAPIELISPFEDIEFCEASTDVISINSNADGFQWEISADNGANWNALVDDEIYDGVNTKNLQITDVLRNYDNHQFRVILTRTGNSCPTTTNPITLTVNPLPVLKTTSTQIEQCISALNEAPSVNLKIEESNISDEVGLRFEYYFDAATTDKIENPSSFPVIVNSSIVVYVKVFSSKSCSDGIVQLTVNVGPAEFDNTLSGIQQAVCDDLLAADGTDNPDLNDDTDNISYFSLDLESIKNQINPPSETRVLFFESIPDRANTTNTIDITNFRNTISKNDVTEIQNGIQFPIYYKIISQINSNCEGFGLFNVQINAVPQANIAANIEFCDDVLSGNSADGVNLNINLRDKASDILGPTQSLSDFNVSFHTSKIGASNNSDLITNDEDYTNEVAPNFVEGTTNEQEIFVRVENLTTGCFNANTSFKIIIQPLPAVPSLVSDLITCDVTTITDSDTRNRIVQNIDLTAKTPEILDGRTGYRVEYYIRQQDAENRTNQIANPSNFQNSTDSSISTFPTNFNTDDPAIQTIFFIVVDDDGLECPSIFSTFQLFVFPEPAVLPISVLSQCDTAEDGDDTNGIIQSIDLNGKIPEILGENRNPDDYNITFHHTQIDADAGENALISPYTNLNPRETVHVRIQQKRSNCVNSSATFELIINPLPDFTVTTPQTLCLNDLPLTLNVENPRDTYSYVWTDLTGNIVSTEQEANITTGGTYTLTATTTNGTFCERIETIVVNESNPAALNRDFVTIIDESNNIGSENNLSISIDTITNNLGLGDYQFAILNTETIERIPFAGFQDEPLFENLEGGIYQIIVNDKNGCSPDTTLLVSVIQFPKFFTPNGDSDNDFWLVKGANQTFYPNSSINIFNRFGKLVAQVPIDTQGWDGTYQGKLLSSDDYWFNITLIPADSSKPAINKKGHFSLLRR